MSPPVDAKDRDWIANYPRGATEARLPNDPACLDLRILQ